MGVEKLSAHFANSLGDKLNKSHEEIAVLNYGFFMIIQTTYSMICILIVGVSTKLLKEVLIISFCSAILKRYTGGVHASTPNRCLTIGIFMATLLTFLCKFCIETLSFRIILYLATIVFLIAYYIIYDKCPVGSKQKPLKNEATRKKFRKKSFNVLSIYLIIEIIIYILLITKEIYLFKSIFLSIIFGIVMQIFSLSEVGEKFVKGLDNLFGSIR